jgi:hypothetical protein
VSWPLRNIPRKTVGDIGNAPKTFVFGGNEGAEKDIEYGMGSKKVTEGC